MRLRFMLLALVAAVATMMFAGWAGAIIVLDGSLSGLGHASLPSIGLAATLATGTKLDISGYGVQHFGKPDPCDPNCKKQPDAFFTRFGATSNLLSVGKGKQGEFVKI